MKQNCKCANCGINLIEGGTIEGKEVFECPVCKEKYEVVEDGKLRMKEK